LTDRAQSNSISYSPSKPLQTMSNQSSSLNASIIPSEFTNPNLEVLYTAEQIKQRVVQLGQQISQDYAGNKNLVLIGILKGSCIFMADLMRAVDLELIIDFMAVSSYKDGTVSSGDIEILKDLTHPIRGKDVIICEDIVDTGLTLFRLTEILGSRGANSIRVATLLDKPETRKKKSKLITAVSKSPINLWWAVV